MTTLYGIKNCDSVKKAQHWLKENNVTYQFHDFRADGLSLELVALFIRQGGWEAVLNKRSTSWRQLEEAQKNSLDSETVVLLLLEIPTLIKRPIIITETQFLIGFTEKAYQVLL